MKNIVLVGNPNTGKTTLFNSLTRGHEHVGNWHGVTVEEKVGQFQFENQKFSVVDLPGIYSLSPLSFEEKVAVEYLNRASAELVVNICDASNLGRNLYLTLSLIERGLNVLLVVNQIDKRPICKVDYGKLERLLGVRVVHLNADNKKDIEGLKGEITKLLGAGKPSATPPHGCADLPADCASSFNQAKKLLQERGVPYEEQAYYAIKLLEDDEEAKAKFKVEMAFGQCEKIAGWRYDKIDKILAQTCTKNQRVYGKSKLDKIFLNRALALPIFLGLLCLVFYLTFFSFGGWLSDCLSGFIELVFNPAKTFIANVYGTQSWVYSLFADALFGGVGAIVSFLPQVALLFFFLSLLEDSGYLARVAFVFDDLLSRVGLSGKGVYTLLMGFGCSTTAVLTARNMEDKNSKIKTALLTPYMSCSAKFPIYAVLGGVFFGANNLFVIVGLYLLGVAVAILLSWVLEKSVLKSKAQSFILEFPPYRMISPKRTLSVLWQNVRLFLSRVGTLIVAMNVVVWVLSNFTITFKFVGNSGVSMLETLGRILAPIFTPLGFASWGLVSALLAGLVAKEVIVSSVAMFAGGQTLASALFTAGSAVYLGSGGAVLSYLAFCLLYAPCLASVGVLIKEIGGKWTAIGIAIQLAVAYAVSFVVYTTSLALSAFGWWATLISLFALAVIVASGVLIAKRIKGKRLCPYSSKCKKSCNKKR
ncbi:MAG: ferrous iron transport protein B [Clostridia bacterium]|nr:ferrous iron transport protein B [Clostridia bacterium]